MVLWRNSEICFQEYSRQNYFLSTVWGEFEENVDLVESTVCVCLCELPWDEPDTATMEEMRGVFPSILSQVLNL